MSSFYQENKKAVVGAGLVTLAGLLVTAIWNLGGFAGEAYIEGIVDARIEASGGVTVAQVDELEIAVTQLQGAVALQVSVNEQQDNRLNDSIDRLDNVIDTMIRAAQNN